MHSEVSFFQNNAQLNSVSTGSVFRMYMPLANWLIGFERYLGVYTKERWPARHFTERVYMLHAQKDDAMLHKKAIGKAKELSMRLSGSSEVVWVESILEESENGMQPNVWTGTGVGWGILGSSVPISKVGFVSEQGELKEMHHEHISAQAFKLLNKNALGWADLTPRTFSVLPVAQACQAKCAFCFSKASVSELPKQKPMDIELAAQWAAKASAAGATRAVITGGGEPTLMNHESLLSLIALLSERFEKTLLISNGLRWGKLSDEELERCVDELASSGLTRLALSRHGTGQAKESQVLGVVSTARRVAAAFIKDGRVAMRSICVLQKGAVDSKQKVKDYLHSMVEEGVLDICFKELYISSLSENPWAGSKENLYAAKNQVPLSIVGDALSELGFAVVESLPWGAPVWQGVLDGKCVSVAAYTEPSVGWELHNGVVRSWNMLSDGACFASLEDPQSVLSLGE